MTVYRITYDNDQQAIDAEKRHLLRTEGSVGIRRRGNVLIVTPPAVVAPLLGMAGALYQLASRLYRLCYQTGCRRRKARSQPALRSE